MDEIVKIKTVYDYDKHIGAETLNPLVNVIDFSKVDPAGFKPMKANYGIYAIFLKDVNCGDLTYGRHNYDYQEGTIVCVAPGQVLGVANKKKLTSIMGWALVFHPDLLKGTSLGQNIKNYGFFSYEVNEALHISEREREVIVDCFKKIKMELEHSIDKFSNKLICRNIELLLDYCFRYYDRQFITRSNANRDVLSKFEGLLDNYFESEEPVINGLPSVKYCADQMHLSANYFGDLIKKETGKSAQEYLQDKIIGIAKERLFDSEKSVSETAYELGFKYPQHFSRMFKKCVGVTPVEYRRIN